MNAEDANVARNAISGKVIDGRKVEVSILLYCRAVIFAVHYLEL